MEKGLLDGLSTLLCHTPPQWVLDEALRGGWPVSRDGGQLYCPEDKFISAFRQEHPERSGTEARGILQLLRTYGSGEHDIFSLILAAAQDYLRMDGAEVCCRHEKMVEWRQATRQTGQSVFLCVFLAYSDLTTDRNREDFSFAPYARSDHLRLRHMLEQGMAENHFHLRGSGPAAFLSWICLMNQIQLGAGTQGFGNVKFQRTLARALGDEGEEAPGRGRFAASRAEYLSALTNTAAYLRVMLWRVLCGTESSAPRTWFPNGSRPWNTRDQIACTNWVRDIQEAIDPERLLSGAHLDYLQAGMILPPLEERPAFYALSGEHRFLYQMFRKLLKDQNWSRRYGPFFYAYLLIFFRFRRELIQCGTEYGFDNFQAYQGRKELFLTEPFQQELLRAAFCSALDDPAVQSLEARIILDPDPAKLSTKLGQYIDSIPLAGHTHAPDPRAFFVVHLPKRADKLLPDPAKLDSLIVPCRHETYRKNYIMPQVEALVSLFRSNDSKAAWIYGLDACSQEIACRPEVFAPAFRYARSMAVPTGRSLPSSRSLPTLRFTYHVGEDFLDMVDGLRAIDEAIRFLELRRGDRLGHALAMGLDPAGWYKRRDFNMVLPAQDVLDNTAWLLHALRRLPDIADRHLEEWLHGQFDICCARIYGRTFPPIQYHQAWRLRGDDPELYLSDALDSAGLQPWRISSNPRHAVLREQGAGARELYYRYHFDVDVRRRGAELMSFRPPDEYAQAVRRIQQELRAWVARLGLGIETNPSSNLLIGGLERYDQHPITVFNDVHLNTPPEGASLFVSINTDDQGIFDTDLENEYALMACAIANTKSPDGQYRYAPEQVYRWLDQVRQMGIEQSFRSIGKRS